MNPEIERHIAAIQHTISVWALTPEPCLDHNIELATENPEEDGATVPFHLVQAFRHHASDARPTLHIAAKRILEEILNRRVPESQVAGFLRLIFDGEAFAALLKWNLRLEVALDGVVTTQLGSAFMVQDREGWVVRCWTRQAETRGAFKAALRLAAAVE